MSNKILDQVMFELNTIPRYSYCQTDFAGSKTWNQTLGGEWIKASDVRKIIERAEAHDREMHL